MAIQALPPSSKHAVTVNYHFQGDHVPRFVDQAYGDKAKNTASSVTLHHCHLPAEDLLPLFMDALRYLKFAEARGMLANLRTCADSLSYAVKDIRCVAAEAINALREQNVTTDNRLYERMLDLYTAAIQKQ